MNAALSTPVHAVQQLKSKSAHAFSAKKTKSIEKIIHSYLLQHPEVLVEASRALQRKQQEAQLAKAKREIKRNRQPLFSANSPVAGNPLGKVSLVEFFDYQCKHCKTMHVVVEGLIAANQHLKVIYKELPIFGAESEFAAKAALAAQKQHKYAQLHQALMAQDAPLTTVKILSLAKQAGLDVAQLKKDMNDSAIEAELKTNLSLARSIGIMGTPAFVLANHMQDKQLRSYFVAGALGQPLLQNLINELTS
jgi:protein-disulfide isomerase